MWMVRESRPERSAIVVHEAIGAPAVREGDEEAATRGRIFERDEGRVVDHPVVIVEEVDQRQNACRRSRTAGIANSGKVEDRVGARREPR